MRGSQGDRDKHLGMSTLKYHLEGEGLSQFNSGQECYGDDLGQVVTEAVTIPETTDVTVTAIISKTYFSLSAGEPNNG